MRCRRSVVIGVVAALLVAALPHQAMAAPFASSVTFPGAGLETVFEDDVEDGVYKWAGCGGDFGVNTVRAYSGTRSNRSSFGDPTCRLSAEYGQPVVGEEYRFTWQGGWWGGNPQGTGSGSLGFGFCNASMVWLTSPTAVSFTGAIWTAAEQVAVAPADTVYFCVRGNSADWVYADDILIEGPQQEGDECLGEGALAWGNPDLTTTHPWYGDGGRYEWLEPAGWGDFWFANIEGSTACQHLFGQASFYYTFPTAPAVGDQFSFLETFLCSSDTTACGVLVYWVNEFGGRISQHEGIDHVAGTRILQGAPDGGGPFTLGSYNEVLVEGVVGVEFEITAGTYLFELMVANVEGTIDDPSHPDFQCPADTWCGPGGGPSLQDCEPPTDPLDVAGWLEYLSCLVGNGFTMVLNAIESVLDAVTAGIGALLEELFVPTSIDDDWTTFYALFSTKVPFVWVVEVGGFLAGFVNSGNLAGADLPVSFSLMGASVNVNVAQVFTPVSQYRWVLVGLVYLAGAVAIWRAVGGALGMRGSE